MERDTNSIKDELSAVFTDLRTEVVYKEGYLQGGWVAYGKGYKFYKG